jgi:membrane protein
VTDRAHIDENESGQVPSAGKGWWRALRRTTQQYRADDCPDLAAGLTYYSVLSLFPAAVVLLSLIAVIGDPQEAVETLLTMLRPVAGPAVLTDLEPILVSLSQSRAAGWGLAVGLTGAVWSASGYVGAFGRALNRILGVRETRAAWKLRLLNIALTLVLLTVAALALIGLVVSGPLATGVGATLGADTAVIQIWSIAKWPLVAALVVFIVAVLYDVAPDLQRPGVRWISPGAFVALVIWATASALFAVYVANFGQYDRIYGSLAGAVLLLLWLWITNLALLFGAELNAQLRRPEAPPAPQGPDQVAATTGKHLVASPRRPRSEQP